MTRRANPASVPTASEEPRARIVLLEEGAAPGTLARFERDFATTAIVGMVGGSSPALVHRIERRISELEHAAMTIAEVVVLLAPNSGESSRSRRLSALRAILRRLHGSGAEIVLVPPSAASADLRREIFGLVESLMAELGPGTRLGIRFAPQTERRESDSFASPSRSDLRNPASGAWRVAS